MTPAVAEKPDSASLGTRLQWDAIRQPGAYVTMPSGHLVRIPDGSLHGQLPPIDVVADEPVVLVMVSPDPFISVGKARMVACDLDLPVNF